jgi:CheY-like chemotaxis protein
MRAQPALPLVLVVDDEPIVRCNVVSELMAHGWPVMAAATGEEALALARRHDVAVLFTEVQLGAEMCGWRLAEEVRKVDPDISILYTSAKETDQARAVEGGVFFAKPYRSDHVIATVARLRGVLR